MRYLIAAAVSLTGVLVLTGQGVTVPSTFATHTPGTVEDRLTAIETKIDRLSAQMAQLIKALEEDEPEPAKSAPSNPLASACGKCAACHSEAAYKTKGKGFQLFGKDKQVVALDAEQIDECRKRIKTKKPDKHMPPPKSGVSLTPEEEAAFDAALAGMSKK